jgi:hypothetical protein
LNDLALEELALCFYLTHKFGKVALSCVNGARTTRIQLGCAREAWKSLVFKYKPKTAPLRLWLCTLFVDLYLRIDQDPDEWITDLEELGERIISSKSKMDDESLMEHVLNNVPGMYNIEISKLEDWLGDPNSPLTLEEICAALSLRYERANAKKGRQNKRYNQNEETALFAGGFKGKCNNCGQYGHKLRDCHHKKKKKKKKNNNNNNNINNNNRNYRNDRNNKNNKGSRDKDNDRKSFPYKCHYCKKEGHMAKDCFKKKHDEKQRGKSANAAQDNDDNKVGFVMLVWMTGFVMLGLDDPESINEWYSEHSVIVEINECVNESLFTRELQHKRFNTLMNAYLVELYRDVAVESESSDDDMPSHTSDDDNMSNLHISSKTETMEEYEAIKKWCKMELDKVINMIECKEQELMRKITNNTEIEIDADWSWDSDSKAEVEGQVSNDICMMNVEEDNNKEEEPVETEGPQEQKGFFDSKEKKWVNFEEWDCWYFFTLGMTQYFF